MKWLRCNQSSSLLVLILSGLAHAGLFLLVTRSFESSSIKASKASKASRAQTSVQAHILPRSPEIPKKKSSPKSLRVNKNLRTHRPKLQAYTNQEAKEEESKEENNNFSNRILRKEPLLINGHTVHVSYPPKARRLKIEGKVRFRLLVNSQGQVAKAEVLDCASDCLLKSALVVIQKLRFLPATDNYGVAQVAEIEHEVIYRLRDRI
jgi:TonB family protein